MDLSPYIKISERDNFTIYSYPKKYLELFLDELFYQKSIEINDDHTFKMSKNGYIIDNFNKESSVDFEYLRQSQIAVYWIHEWYDYLIKNSDNKNITFKTKLIELSNEDIESLFNFKTYGIIPESLLKIIDDSITEINNLCFVRTDAYSPKDLVFENKIDNLKVSDALTAIKLITDSERCCQKLFSNDQIISKYLAIREYVNLDTNYEFRCFIYNWNLRAICQSGFEYNSELHAKKKFIRDSILKFWNKFESICPYSECTMDIIYDNNFKNTLNDSCIMIIEFNSFGPHMNADSGLYDWDRDYVLLTKSNQPHFLLAEKPLNTI